MKAGVSDLIFYELGSDGFIEVIGIELKFPGEGHKRKHIEKQLKFGKTLVSKGGQFFIVTSIEGFMSIIEGGPIDSGVYTIEAIEKKLKENEKNTIIF